MKLHFYGAASEVTGSNFVLETDKYRIMVDCGLFQGMKTAEAQNYERLPYDTKSIDAVILTHAHLDHCGRLPYLWKSGYRGKIYTTPATRDLAELIMTDAAQVMLYEAEEDQHEPLYDAVDVAAIMPHFEPVEYHTVTQILPGVTIELFDAGHILGSASVVITVEGKRIVFSGDIGNHPVPILRTPETPPSADIVVMETTYGDRLHENGRDRRMKLRAVIRRAAEQKGTLLIPAFALERTQEILYEMHQLVEEQTIPAMPVFLDSPLAIHATNVYGEYERYFSEEALLLKKNSGDLFDFPFLKITATVGQSKAIAQVEAPNVIIAGSGMMEGGRAVIHAKDLLPDPSAIVAMVGYQGAGTLGRRLYDGERKVKVKGQWIMVKAHIIAISAYSAHADQKALLQWLDAFQDKPKQVFLVHGEQASATTFAGLISKEYQAKVPTLNETVELY